MWFGAGGNSSSQRQQQQQPHQQQPHQQQPQQQQPQQQPLPEIQQWLGQQQASGHRGRSSSSSNGSPSSQLGQLDPASPSQTQQQLHSSSQQSVTGQPPTPTLAATPAAAGNQQLQQQQSHHTSHSSTSTSGYSSHCSGRQERISFHLKTSIFTQRVTLETDKMALGMIKQLAIAFLNDIYFKHQYPANTYIGDYIRKHLGNIDNQQALYERLVLRKYNCQQESFVPFNSVSDIEPESHISIEVSEKQQHLLPGACSVSVSPASSSNSAGGWHPAPAPAAGATSAHQAGASLSAAGPVGQLSSASGGQLAAGVLGAPPTNQASSSVSLSSNSSSSNVSGFHQPSPAGQLKIAHEFNIESFLRLTYCALCTALIKGFLRQGYQCSFCKKNFCKECKVKAESSGDVCLAPPSPSSHHQQQQQQSSAAASATESGASNGNADPAAAAAPNSNHVQPVDSPGSQTASSANKLDSAHSNMSKRKSASNLLHFTIANPFKSHHASSASAAGSQQPAAAANGNNQQASGHQQVDKTKSRGSAGALDPVLQQLSRMREQQQQPHQQPLEPLRVAPPQRASREGAAGAGNLMVMAQTAHLSSSHQNLFTGGARLETPRCSQEDYDQARLVGGGGGSGGSAAGSSSAHQSPIGSRHHASQLSNSARTSASDLHANSSCVSSQAAAAAAAAAAAIPKPRDHSFVCMDWIQVKSSAVCQVCNKPLKSASLVRQQQQQFEPQQQTKLTTPFMCKSCQLQVHGHCQRLVLANCMSRIAESSRAAAERTDSAGQSAASSSNDNNNNNNSAAADNTAKNSSAADERTGLRGTNSNVSRDNIPLHRLQTSVRHVKPPNSSEPLIEAWLWHTTRHTARSSTLAAEQARQHYWRLDQQEITLYDSDTTTRYFKAVAVNKITRVMSADSLPEEDVVLMTTLAKSAAASSAGASNSHSGRQQQSPPASALDSGLDFASSDASTSPARSAESRAVFAFELATGLLFLVQAGSRAEAARWRATLASVIASQRPPAAQSAAPATTPASPPGHSGAAANEPRQLELGAPAANAAPSGQETGSAPRDQPAPAGSPESSARAEPPSAARLERGDTSAAKPAAAAADASRESTNADQGEQQAACSEQLSAAQAAQTAGAGATATAPAEAPRQPPVQRHQRTRYPPVQRFHRGQHKTHTDPNRSRLYNRPRITIELDPMSIPDHMIECKYLVERDRVKKVGFQELGSGQFGKVYAAISEWKREEDPHRSLWSGVPVAIKEISKARFDLRQQAKLKNEANILSHLDHPGVIILERVHDLPDKIYIVMEQLEDDMLEMIVSSKEKRLNERVTKFLTYQIIEALKYLHAQNIAHCDLKPENVLLVERRSQFPQIKLCDFGFAKIIEENSFRSSLVGTPAYLAPEVVKGERYNRSVDLWSVGVIVYVSLSGEFPFNEGENIHDQISRANFMYPDKPWAQISKEAKSFINSLLRVNCERRLVASQAQMDKWLQEYQLWCDLTELEVRVGRRWMTDDADYKIWSSYAAEHNLQVPRSAIQLYEEHNAD